MKGLLDQEKFQKVISLKGIWSTVLCKIKASLRKKSENNFVDSLSSSEFQNGKSKSFASKASENKYFWSEDSNENARRFNSNLNRAWINEVLKNEQKAQTPSSSSFQRSKGSTTLKEDISLLLKQAVKLRKHGSSDPSHSIHEFCDIVNKEEDFNNHKLKNRSDSNDNFVTMNDIHPGY